MLLSRLSLFFVIILSVILFFFVVSKYPTFHREVGIPLNSMRRASFSSLEEVTSNAMVLIETLEKDNYKKNLSFRVLRNKIIKIIKIIDENSAGETVLTLIQLQMDKQISHPFFLFLESYIVYLFILFLSTIWTIVHVVNGDFLED